MGDPPDSDGVRIRKIQQSDVPRAIAILDEWDMVPETDRSQTTKWYIERFGYKRVGTNQKNATSACPTRTSGPSLNSTSNSGRTRVGD